MYSGVFPGSKQKAVEKLVYSGVFPVYLCGSPGMRTVNKRLATLSHSRPPLPTLAPPHLYPYPFLVGKQLGANHHCPNEHVGCGKRAGKRAGKYDWFSRSYHLTTVKDNRTVKMNTKLCTIPRAHTPYTCARVRKEVECPQGNAVTCVHARVSRIRRLTHARAHDENKKW